MTGPGSKDVQQLKNAAGVMGSIITDEHPASRAIMLEGVGPQLRIYCRYGMKAVEEGGKRGFPDLESDGGRLDDARALRCREHRLGEEVACRRQSPRIKVFDVAEADRAEEEEGDCRGEGRRQRGCGLEHREDSDMARRLTLTRRAFTQTHSIVFLSDNLRNTLREVIRENGISPDKLMQDWETIERGIQTWLSQAT